MADEILDENVDMLEEMLGGEGAGGAGGAPSRKQLLELLDSADLTEEMREKLRGMLSSGAPQLFGTSGGMFLGFIFVVISFSIILFFGYKLYKSIKDKELKKLEKKKAKEMKKKK